MVFSKCAIYMLTSRRKENVVGYPWQGMAQMVRKRTHPRMIKQTRKLVRIKWKHITYIYYLSYVVLCDQRDQNFFVCSEQQKIWPWETRIKEKH